MSIMTTDGVAVATIDIQPSTETVHHACARISAQTHVPIHRQQLFNAGRELRRDGRTLAEHGVHGQAQLELVKHGRHSDFSPDHYFIYVYILYIYIYIM